MINLKKQIYCELRGCSSMVYALVEDISLHYFNLIVKWLFLTAGFLAKNYISLDSAKTSPPIRES